MAHILANIYKLNNAIIRMTTAASVIDSYVCSALMQPPFTFQNETNEGIQQELKEIATMWSFRTRQSLSQTNKDIVSFCEIYICLYPRLVHYASRVDDKDKKKSEAAKSSFTILWEILHEEVNSRLFACGGFFDELSKFRERSETEQPILDTRVQGVISKFDEEKRLKLKKLRDQIAEKKGDMSEEMKIIVLGTISDVGGLMIAVGSLGKVKLGGVSTIVVSSGLGVAGDISQKINDASKEYNEKARELAKLTKESQKLSNEFASLNNLKTDLALIITHTREVLEELEHIKTLWKTLRSKFHNTTEFLDKGSGNMLDTLKFGKCDCEEVAKTVNAIQSCVLHLDMDTSNLHSGLAPEANIASKEEKV